MTAVDHVVVGGGVYGTAVAWGLAQRGASVTLVERATVACGASGGPGKRGVRACGRDPRELPLMRRAYDVWPELADRLDGETGYERLGGLQLAEKATADDELAWSAVLAQRDVQQAHGIPTDLVPGEEARELEPDLSDDVRGALFCPLDGIADHTATTRAFAAAASRHGAHVREHVAVTALRRTAGATTVELSDGGTLTPQHGTFLLANSYARQLLADSFGIRLPMVRMAPQVTLVQPVDGYRPTRLSGHFTRRLAVKPLPDGSTMVSGGRRGTWHDGADAGIADDLEARGNLADAAAVHPGLDGATIVDNDAARPESIAPDDVPVVDLVPGTDDVYVGTGWSGHGFAIAPAVAAALVDWATIGTRPTVLAPFTFQRLVP